MVEEIIRYYAKVNARDEIFFGVDYIEASGAVGGIAYRATPESIAGFILERQKQHPAATLVNGPHPNLDKRYHSDGFGEFRLRPLTNAEENQLLAALNGK